MTPFELPGSSARISKRTQIGRSRGTLRQVDFQIVEAPGFGGGGREMFGSRASVSPGVVIRVTLKRSLPNIVAEGEMSDRHAA